MTIRNHKKLNGGVSLTTLSIIAALASGCSSDDSNTTSTDVPDTTETVSVFESLAPTKFVAGALASDPSIVDCTLSDGTETSCYEIVTVGVPADSAVGPFCPQNNKQ